MLYSVGRHYGPLEATMPNVFQFLSVSAGPTVIERINNYLLMPVSPGGRNNINRLENLLCLSANCHELFGHGIFVLEPLGDPLERLTDETQTLNEYDVRFSWVAQHRAPQLVLPGRYLMI